LSFKFISKVLIKTVIVNDAGVTETRMASCFNQTPLEGLPRVTFLVEEIHWQTKQV